VIAPTEAPPQADREATLADLRDLRDLIRRVEAASARMSRQNIHREMLADCHWWLQMLAARVVTLQQANAELQEKRDRRIIMPGY
jgi:hypothetical protein